MSGATNSTNLIESQNQTVKAINDLSTSQASSYGAMVLKLEAIEAAIAALQLSPIIRVVTSGAGGCGTNCIPGGYGLVQPSPAAGQPSPGFPDPENPPSGYNPGVGGPTYDAYKCKGAKFLTDAYLAHCRHILAIAGALSVLSPSAIFAPLPDAFMALISPAIAFALASYLVTVWVGATSISAILATYISNLEDGLNDCLCAIYTAQSVTEVRQALADWMDNATPIDLPGDWTDYHISNLFPNSVLNIVFEYYEPVSEVTGEDCSSCYTYPEFKINVYQGQYYATLEEIYDGGSYDSENNVISSNDFLMASTVDHAQPANGYAVQLFMASPLNLSFDFDVTGFTAKSYEGGAVWYKLASGGDQKQMSFPADGTCLTFAYFYAWSSTPFTVRFTVNDPC